MDRSLYPEGVEVHQVDLERTEDTRSFHILKRHVDNSLSGVVSGLSVTTNSGSQSLVDVEAGYGYVPDGEMVQLVSGVTAISLSNYSSGVENLITLVYSETHDVTRPHETSNDSLPTAANRSVRLRVFTRTQYDLLPSSDDNLDNDARDRTLIISSILAQGDGIPIPSSAITNSPVYGGAISVINSTNNITGMTISSAEAGTANGTGSVTYSANNGTLTWIAPGDISGNPINVLLGGFFNLQSVSSNKNLLVFVSAAVLPASDTVDTIEIQNLYYEDVPRHSAEDIQHRSIIGSGVPTQSNPHGLTITDLGIAGTPIEEHQTLFHSNGIRRDSDPNTLLSIVNPGTSPDELNITVAPNFYVYLRGTLFTSSNQVVVSFTDVVDNTQIVYDIYAKNGSNNEVDIEKRERIRFDALSTMTGHLQLRDVSRVTPAGVGSITFDDVLDEISYKAPGDPVPGIARGIPTVTTAVRLYSDNRIDYVDVLVSPTLAGTGDVVAPITITGLPTDAELDDRLYLSTVVYSGSATGFLGNGFGTNNLPNEVLDKRLFGITSYEDIRDDSLPWLVGQTNEAQSPAAITHLQAGSISPDFDFYHANSHNYVDGRSQFEISGKAHVLGRNTTQAALVNRIQYSTAEEGTKTSLRSQLLTDFSSGTIDIAVNVHAQSRLRHVGGSIAYTDAYFGQIDVDAGANVDTVAGMFIGTPGGSHAIATEITNLYGINISDQNRGVNNWAIKTGAGTVHFGDTVQIMDPAFYISIVASDPRIVFDNAGSIEDRLVYDRSSNKLKAYINAVHVWDCDSGGFDFSITEKTNIRWGANGYRDGSTNPGVDGARIGYASTGLQAIVNATGNIPNDFLLIEKTDNSATTPDGAIVFANTGSNGVIDASLIIQGDGDILPGFTDGQNLGIASQRWAFIHAASYRGDIFYGINKESFRTFAAQTYDIGFSATQNAVSNNLFQNGGSRGYGSGITLHKTDGGGILSVPCGGFKYGKLVQVHAYWTKQNMFQAFNVRVRLYKRISSANSDGVQVATEFNTGVTDAYQVYDTVFNVFTADQDIDELSHFYVEFEFTTAGWAAGDNEPMIINGGKAEVSATIITPAGFVG